MKHLGKLAILGAFIVASASFASASTITPGGADAAPTPISLTTLDTGTSVTSITGTLSGSNPSDGSILGATFTESIYEGGTDALCPTCLAFAFTFTNSTGNDDLEELAVSDFTGYTTDADYVVGPTTTTIAPSSVNETDAGTVNYDYNPTTVNPGESSDEVVIFTNATSYSSGGISLQDGAVGQGSDLAPAPEPGTLFLLGTGLLGAAGIARRKFAAKFV